MGYYSTYDDPMISGEFGAVLLNVLGTEAEDEPD